MTPKAMAMWGMGRARGECWKSARHRRGDRQYCERLGPEDQLDLVELNDEFVRRLRERLTSGGGIPAGRRADAGAAPKGGRFAARRSRTT